ncbi:MAG: CHAP domain-containing protein [Rubricoccaceae bacterium]
MRGWIFVVVALLVSAALVAVTFAAVPALSGFAAGLLKAALAVGAFWAFDRFVLRDLDTVAELKAGNVAYGLMLVALALLLAATVATAQPVSRRAVEAPARSEAGELAVGIAAGYVGTVEKGGANRGPEVEAFQRAVGIPPGSAWCAAFVGFILDEAERQSGRRLVPAVRSGVATRYVGRESVRARDVLRGASRPPVGSLVVWRRGATWRGHVGFVLRDDNASVRGPAWYLRCGRTIEGNTSSGSAGSQADGDGVWERVRCIQPGAYFRIVAFTPVRYGDGASP